MRANLFQIAVLCYDGYQTTYYVNAEASALAGPFAQGRQPLLVGMAGYPGVKAYFRLWLCKHIGPVCNGKVTNSTSTDHSALSLQSLRRCSKCTGASTATAKSSHRCRALSLLAAQSLLKVAAGKRTEASTAAARMNGWRCWGLPWT